MHPKAQATDLHVLLPLLRRRLDVVLGGALRLRDQFWWDLHAASPSPEEFAAELCVDSGIDACHGTAVAAAIRTEVGGWWVGSRAV